MLQLTNAKTFLQVYADVLAGHMTYPRGQKCIEVTDYQFQLDMTQSPLTSFRARNLNLKYAKEEMKWYLGGDKYDKSIEQYASMWKKIRQPDGSYYSNYGQYIFPHQFNFVIAELLNDPWSRRASIVLLKEEHLFSDNSDVVCTYSINFRIRNSRLDMSVNMRSNDVIFGMTNDVFCFAMLYRLVYAHLIKNTTIVPGRYVHKVDSLHVYERHFAMIKQIVDEGLSGYEPIYVPWPKSVEADIAVRYKKPVDHTGEWSQWMNE